VREAQVIVAIPDAWSLPGDTVTMTLNIDNQTERDDPIAAFQSHLTYSDTFATVLDVQPTPRIDGLFDWNIPDPGRLIIVFATSELEAIASGTGPVAEITFEVNPSVTVGDSTRIHFDRVVLSDTVGIAIPLRVQDGTLFLGTGIKGDVNMDGEVDVLDAVWMINYILERIEFTTFQFWAADCNEDDAVDILDVVGIINVILGLGTCPPTSSLAKIAISPASIWSPGEEAEFTHGRLELPLAIRSEHDMTGIQLILGYDPTALHPQAPQLRGRASHMKLDHEWADGRWVILIYNPDGTSIPAGSGSILTASFSMRNSKSTTQRPMIEISEALLAGEGCREIPVDIYPINLKGDLQPETWVLEQNYPNPFNPTTTIIYSVPTTELTPWVSLKIYNIVGQEVRTLVNERKAPGRHRATWDGKDEEGRKVSSGVYLYTLSAGGTSRDLQGEFRATKRMVLVK
ncbi:MAG: T9SS type A sorting domain-containing protein, partial [Gemmatimonadota bacterium]